MKTSEFITEMDCWDGYKKDGTQKGTGKNKGKRVNKCVPAEAVEEVKIDEAAKPVAVIKIDDFLDWVYSDRDEYTELGNQMIKELQATGKASLTLNDILVGLGYLPTSKIENFEDIEAQLTGVQGIDDEEIVNPSLYIDVKWVK